MITHASTLELRAVCIHCGQGLSAGQYEFCCAGCRAVNRLLDDSGLQRYYDLRPAKILPLLNYFDRADSLEWVKTQPGFGEGQLDLALEGVQCGACVWAIEQFAARQGSASVEVNTALGRLRLRWDFEKFNVSTYLETLRDLGYRVRPVDDNNRESGESSSLLIRLGVCSAIAMNTMFFSIAIYAGLVPDGTGLFEALIWVNLLLSAVSLAVGGSYFIGRAARALAKGVVHFDIPIALGIVAAFGGSVWAWIHNIEGSVFFDSMNVFIALMLAGRFAQMRVLAKNRRNILASDSFDKCLVTAIKDSAGDIRFDQVRKGDQLLVQPGAMVPVESILQGQYALEFDLAASKGESEPVLIKPGEVLPAGSRLQSLCAALIEARTDFNRSLLATLLPANRANGENLPLLWRWVVRWYVGLVIAAAFTALIYWSVVDPSIAARAFISTLVVTCPCGLGIAIPLARTLANRRLTGMGVVVKDPSLLDRLNSIKRVVLDKTGTLTLSILELANPDEFKRLAEEDRQALMSAAMSSRHPVSRALYAQLSARGQHFMEGRAREEPGQGVTWSCEKNHWHLGRPGEGNSTVEFSRNGKQLAAFELNERLLENAADAIKQLRARGLSVQMLSGDRDERVAAMARQLGLEKHEAFSAQNPTDKEKKVDGECLMLGDGLNDGPAMARAGISGSPTWERSPVADKADFSFTSATLAWLPDLFKTGDRLRKTVWMNLVFALVYNGSFAALAMSGRVSPLFCAVVMPLSSLLVIAGTVSQMEKS